MSVTRSNATSASALTKANVFCDENKDDFLQQHTATAEQWKTVDQIELLFDLLKI